VRKPLHKDHINDLYTTTCSGMLGHRRKSGRARTWTPVKISPRPPPRSTGVVAPLTVGTDLPAVAVFLRSASRQGSCAAASSCFDFCGWAIMGFFYAVVAFRSVEPHEAAHWPSPVGLVEKTSS
jgi:hypothetical protein